MARFFIGKYFNPIALSIEVNHPDAYQTIVKSASGDFRDRGSKFPSLIFPCKNETQLKERIEEAKKDHPTARHFCFGAIIGSKERMERYSDDGEPKGSAGFPILNQLLSANLCDTGLVVVRYFGGTKLGKAGLINAYKVSAQDAIENARIVTAYNRQRLEFRFAYDETGTVMKAIDQIEHATILDQIYGQGCTLIADVPESDIKRTLHLFDHTDEVTVRIPNH